MKHHKKIKGRAIALRCVCDDGYYLIRKDEIYLGIPSSHHELFEIFIPYYKPNPKSFRYSKTIPYPKSYFDPINPLHKHNPLYY